MSNTAILSLPHFLAAASDEFAAGASPATRLTSQMLRSIDSTIADAPPAPIHDNDVACSPPDEINMLVGSQAESACLTAVASVYRELDWYESTKSHTPYAEIIGPTSLIRSLELRFGLFLLYSDIVYPDHQHAADEVYIVLAGTGEWSLNREPYQDKTAGAINHFPFLQMLTEYKSERPTSLQPFWYVYTINNDPQKLHSYF